MKKIKKTVRERVTTRRRKIATKYGITYHEVNKVWESQFKMAKEHLEKFSKEELSTMSEEELSKIVINFMYIGKIYTGGKVQKRGDKANESRIKRNKTNGRKKTSKEERS